MKRAVVLSVSSFDVLGPAARVLEERGLDRAWVTELPGRDAIVRAAHTAEQTQGILVGTGIAYAFTRHPVAMASAALEANAMTAGRITVGIGAGPADIRKHLGVEFDKPAARLGEYIDFVRTALTAKDGLHFAGEFYSADLPLFTSTLPDAMRNAIKVYGSGVNPLALRTMAGVADGIALHPLGAFRPYLDRVVLPAIAAGAGQRAIDIAAWCVTSIDPDPAAARSRASTRLALYLANPAFRGVLDSTPWTKVLDTLQEAVRASAGRPNWAELGKLLPAELIDELAVTGTPDEVRHKLRDLQADLETRGITELALQVSSMGGTDEQLLREITAIADAAAM